MTRKEEIDKYEFETLMIDSWFTFSVPSLTLIFNFILLGLQLIKHLLDQILKREMARDPADRQRENRL